MVERTGKNDGARIAEYLGYCNIKSPAAYCAAWVSWVFGQAGYSEPRTAWSPSLFPKARLVKELKPGIVYGLYYISLDRIGHCGLLENVKNDWINGIEANTNEAGSREGQGVYRKIRHKRTIHCFADWLK
ncbi:NlpC/P60 family protein [Pedobacter frigoris]|uniref:peptidoglycan-binding protein n=1 Tax=Pedobacter frigoris TaxID=2571272 RepID=UPI001CEC3546|nr:peptidoglycan-binding protein [Pedobacter frigoris]